MSANARVGWAATRRLGMGSAVEYATCAFPMQRVTPRTICARTASKLPEAAAAIMHATGMEVVPIPADLRSLAGCEGFVKQAAARTQGTSSEAIIGQLINSIPSGRVGTGDDIADVVCFLVSERASYVNGAALVVDGSMSLVI